MMGIERSQKNQVEGTPADSVPIEDFSWWPASHHVVRRVRGATRAETVTRLRLAPASDGPDDLRAAFDLAWLRLRRPPPMPRHRWGRGIRIVELFSGCGGMTLGAVEACRAAGYRATPTLAVDCDDVCAGTYHRNFPSATVLPAAIEALVDGACGRRPSTSERALRKRVGRVSLLLGGPPCQGNSDLNNRTRRRDPKNALMERMARFAEIAEPDHVVIENVLGVVHDQGRVVDRTTRLLEQLGYHVSWGFVDLLTIGVPQRRRRFVLVASSEPVALEEIIAGFKARPRAVGWAIADILSLEGTTALDTPSEASQENRARMDYLFARGLHDLPDALRPACHRENHHTYRSVYGRLRWDQPAQTITTGFCSMGQGRYVHPLRKRTLTPHEAARLQFFPDFFDFGSVARTRAAEMIGNAVPPKLAYVLVLGLLGQQVGPSGPSDRPNA